MGRRYPQVHDGDRLMPVMRGYKVACCDCGLVHVFDFEVMREAKTGKHTSRLTKPRNQAALRVVLMPRRDNRATAQYRRAHKVGK